MKNRFLKVDYPKRKRPPDNAPVLLRVRHLKRTSPFDADVARRELTSYPVTVWYGGPVTYRQAQDVLRQLGTWMTSMGRAWAAEIVPIAPQLAGHRWPWTRFKWWAKTEKKPRALYRLVMTSPVNFKWQRWTV